MNLYQGNTPILRWELISGKSKRGPEIFSSRKALGGPAKLVQVHQNARQPCQEGLKQKKVGHHDLLPARGMGGEGITWRCKRNTNQR